MKKVCMAFSTKDRVALSVQSVKPLLQPDKFDLWWIDGSATLEGQELPEQYNHGMHVVSGITGGPDHAIVCALTYMLEAGYEYLGLCENDVLLEPDWFERTMALFEKGSADGLVVGAVSARAYADRVLIHRGEYAIMLNLGAGHVIFTRAAARAVLEHYRTGWWHDTRCVFAQLSGIDIGRYAAFRGNEQWTSIDWGFDAVLAQEGMASLALTPSACDMIGQEPPLEEQGLVLVKEAGELARDFGQAFGLFKLRTALIRSGALRIETIKPIWHHHDQYLYFAHQLQPQNDYPSGWRLRKSQGFGGFAYRADAPFAQIELKLFGPVTFLVSGGAKGAKVTLKDLDSGYEVSPDLPAGEQQIAQLQVPGGMSYRQIILTCAEGAVFYGVQTVEPQPSTDAKFDFHSLPPV